MNLLDRAIAAVSPERAARRARARVQIARLDAYSRVMFGYGTGGYDGAKGKSAGLRNWNPLEKSADHDTVPDLPDLRTRSRDLVRNAPLASGAVNTNVTSVVGSGLTLQATPDREALGLTPEQAAEWAKRAQRIFATWAESCDRSRSQCFADTQDLVFRSMLESGDVFVVRRFTERRGELLGTRIQLIEADRVRTPPDLAGNARLVDGVELDAEGAAIRYHISSHHEHDFLGRSALVPEWRTVRAFGSRTGERQVLHVFRKTRPGLTRGVPYLAPVMEALKQLDRYTDAELRAALVSGLLTVFVKTEAGDGLANQQDPDDAGVEDQEREVALAPGGVVALRPGESVDTTKPGRPNAAFDPFVQAILRQMGASLEVPYEVLIRHFSSSYSAARASILEAWRYFQGRRVFLERNYCQPVYRWVMTEAVQRGLIEAPGFFADPQIRRAWLAATWTGRPQGNVDPKKEVDSAVVALERGFASLDDLTTELRGKDWEVVLAQRIKERQAYEAAGLTYPGDRQAATAPSAAANRDDDPEDDDERDPEDEEREQDDEGEDEDA